MTHGAHDTLLRTLHEPNISSVLVPYIMLEVRKELERRKEWQSKFPILRFYCDWCMHSQIDYNKHCITLIRELNQCLWQLDEDGNHDAFLEMSNDKFLHIPQLRSELGIVLSAMLGDKVYPSMTYIQTLFLYLKGASVIPVDELTGSLARGKKAYNDLCEELNISPERPLLKNLTITDVDPTCLQYDIEMDGVESVIHNELEMPVCSDPPFLFADERKHEERFAEWIKHAIILYQKRQLEDALYVLKKAHQLLPEVQGMDVEKAQLFHITMEVEWARTGDLAVLNLGEMAMNYISNPIERSQLYCHMGEYALQRNKDIPEALAKAREYIEKSLSYEIYDAFKVRPMHIRGKILTISRQMDAALDVYNEAARYAEESHNEVELALIRSELAYVLEQKGLPELALAEYTHAENIAQLSAHGITIVSCAIRKAQFLIRQGDKDTACMVVSNIKELD